MMRYLQLLMLLFSFQSAAENYYFWLDEKGVEHYSDKAPPAKINAQTLPLPVPSTSSSSQPVAIKDTLAKTNKQQPKIKASKISILTPSNQQSIRNSLGEITVELATDKALSAEQYIVLVLNGKKQAKQKTLSYVFNHLDRGAHKLQAELIEGKKVLARSQQITFFLHRNTIIKPKR